eukprot:TRINITY_DN122_c0_g1_i5.p1 TRINITY_DN122_c0_g1~~TRINITY_DN122_c0_g1_i5.p1  ORF type:complete len:207 (+),score=-32.71 TRINITY_DN122_c0_g1_i5:176-796(+)
MIIKNIQFQCLINNQYQFVQTIQNNIIHMHTYYVHIQISLIYFVFLKTDLFGYISLVDSASSTYDTRIFYNQYFFAFFFILLWKTSTNIFFFIICLNNISTIYIYIYQNTITTQCYFLNYSLFLCILSIYSGTHLRMYTLQNVQIIVVLTIYYTYVHDQYIILLIIYIKYYFLNQSGFFFPCIISIYYGIQLRKNQKCAQNCEYIK